MGTIASTMLEMKLTSDDHRKAVCRAGSSNSFRNTVPIQHIAAEFAY